MGKSEVLRFADGEIMAKCNSDVQGKICYVVQSTVSPSTETIFEVLMFADALKNAGAFEVVLIAPYFGYSRQDRVAVKGEPITAKLVAKMIEIAGIYILNRFKDFSQFLSKILIQAHCSEDILQNDLMS